MQERLSIKWQKVPKHIRRPIVLTLGLFFVLLSGAIGWLPGPGGIPIFLLGIAILSTEFHWAERLKRKILHYIHATGAWIRIHSRISLLITLFGLILLAFITYMLLYTK